MGTEIVEVPVQVVEKKHWWKSKTLWFNIGLGVGDVISYLATSGIIPGSSIIAIGGNIILRFLSNKKLTGKKDLTPTVSDQTDQK